jgi:RHS repeat-associated protein
VEVTATNGDGTATAASASTVVASASSYVGEVHAAGPVAFWPLDDGSLSTAFDVSGSGNDGTYSSGVTDGMLDQAGIDGGGSLGLTGDSSAYVQFSPSVVPSSSAPFTAQAWFKTSSAPGIIIGTESVVDGDSPSGWAPMLYVDSSGYLEGKLWWDGDQTTLVSSMPVDDGAWHEAVLSVDADGNQTLTVDGVQQATDSLGSVDLDAPYATIGAGFADLWPGGLSGWTGFDGQIADVAFYNSTLSSSTIESQYNAADIAPAATSAPAITGTAEVGNTLTASSGAWAGSSPISYSYQWEDCSSPAETSCSNISGATSSTYTVQDSDDGSYVAVIVTATNSAGSATASSTSAAVASSSSYVGEVQAVGPVAFWQLDDGSLGTAFDSSGNGNNGTYSSGVTDGMLDRPGFGAGGSLGLTGDSSAYVQMPVSLLPEASSASEFTVQVWFKTSSASGVIVGTESVLGGDSSSDWGPVLYVDSSGYLEGKAWLGGSVSTLTSLAPVDDGNWHEAVLTVTTGGSETLTVDGVQQATGTLGSGDLDAPYATIGAGYDYLWPGGQDGWTGFDGQIADVALYDSALSSSTIADQYNAAGITPSVTSAPSVSGTPVAGQTLIVSAGSWTGSGSLSYAYQWQDCSSPAETSCSNISGATSSTYTVQTSDEGSYVSVDVTASNSDGSASAISAGAFVGAESSYVGEVEAADPVAFWQLNDASAPTAVDSSGNGNDGTYSSGVTSGMLDQPGFGAGGSLGLSGDSSAYVQVPAGLLPSSPSAFTVQVWFKTSSPSGVILGSENAFGAPSSYVPNLYVDSSGYLEGDVWFDASGNMVTSLAPVDDGAWHEAVLSVDADGHETLTLDGVQQSTVTLGSVDWVPSYASIGAGEGTNWPGLSGWTGFDGQIADVAFYDSVLSDSDLAAQEFAPETSVASAIVGEAEDLHTLTASTSDWVGSPAPTFTYQWSDCSSLGASCSPISGATSPTYTAQSSDVGSTLEVTVTGSNTVGSDSVTSAPTVVVAPSPPVNVTAPTVSGSPVAGVTLTMTSGTWVGTGSISYGYQWFDCPSGGSCTLISGATSSSYTLTSGDAGDVVQVAETATSAYGTNTAMTQTSIAVVAGPPTNTTVPTITGDANVGDTLAASPGSWSQAPTSYAYQWEECDSLGGSCSPISGATSDGYTPQLADAGSTIAVAVTASNAAGSSSSAMSGPTSAVTDVQPSACSPHISSVSGISSGSGDQTVTIDGSCLGSQAPYDGDSNDIHIADISANWNACYLPEGNYVTCNISSWTDTSITLTSFDGDYGSPWTPWTFDSGDSVQVVIDNPTNGNGPAYCALTVGAGGATCDGGAPPPGVLGQGDAVLDNDTCQGGPGTVDCASGDMNDSFTDIKVPGTGGGLVVSRTYNSINAQQSGGLFGNGFSCSFCWSLATDGLGNVTVTEGDGSQATATPNGSGGYDVPALYNSTLTQNEDGSWTFVRRHGDTYAFNSSGQLTGITDLNGYTTSFAYTDGSLSSITDADGQSLAVLTNGAGAVTQITDPVGLETHYVYNGAGDLTSVMNQDGDEWQYGYNDVGDMTSMTDPDGNTTTTTFDSANRVLSQTQQDGAVTTYSYSGDPFSNVGGSTLITDPNGHEEQQNYTNGEMVSLTKGYGTSGAETWNYTYDPSTGAMTSEQTPDGNTTTYTYDSDGNMLTKTEPSGHEWHYTYNDLDEVLTAEDPDGVTTTNTYDSDGNIETTSTPLLDSSGDTTATQETQYTYGDSSLPGYATAIEDPNGNTTNYVYGAHGNLTSKTDPADDKTTYSYDADGRVEAETSPKGNVSGCGCASDYTTTYNSYNALNEPLSVTDPDGNETVNTYDADGNLATSTQPSGTETLYTYNDLNDPTEVQVKDSSGTVVQTTHTSYDLDGNVKTQTDGAGNVTATYGYNSLNQETSSEDARDKTTSYAYTGDGNLYTTTTPDGVTSTNTYNDDDLLTGTSYSDSTPSIGYSYDDDGRQTGMSDGTGTSAWTFNSLGQLTSYTNGAGAEVQYAYDLDGNQTSVTYPGSHTVDQVFNDADQMTSITDWNSNESTFSYDPDGNLTTEDLANGVTDSYTYDHADNPTGIDDSDGSTTVFSADYGRNSDEKISTDSSQPTGTGEYQYTALNQICYAGSTNTAACDDAPTGADTYSYDAAGNLTNDNGTTQSFNAGDQLCWTYTGSSSNACGTAPSGATTYSYDDDGNRTTTTPASGSATAYTYNGADQLTQYQLGSSTPTTYAYDGQGLRESKTTGSTTTNFLWDESSSPALLLQETAGSDTTSYIYGPTGLPLEEILPSGDTYYYAHDSLGSTRVLTDSSGDVQDTDTYDSYGNLTASTGTVPNNLLYAGEYLDPETGLYYLRARYYDPTTGQFLTVDPLVAETEQAYSYAGDDPINVTDPTGLCGSTSSWGSFWANCGSDAVSAAGPASTVLGAAALVVAPEIAIPVAGAAALLSGVSSVNEFAHGNYVAGTLDAAGSAFGVAGFGVGLNAAEAVAEENDARAALAEFGANAPASSTLEGYAESAADYAALRGGAAGFASRAAALGLYSLGFGLGSTVNNAYGASILCEPL